MSFFDTAERKIEPQYTNQPSYETQQLPQKEQQAPKLRNSYAPFGTLSKRRTKTPKKKELGPGSYEIHRDLVAPNISHFQNERCIIIKINDEGSSAFRSQTKRFEKSAQNSIGPGDYKVEKQIQTAHKRKKSFSSSTGIIRNLNKDYYLKYRKPQTLANLNDSQQKVEVFENASSKRAKSKSIISWNLEKAERFKTEPQEFFTEQDKKKLLAELKESKTEKRVKASTSFSSKSVRSHMDSIIYKTKNPLKIEVLNDVKNFKDTMPGPGSYNAQLPKSTSFASTKYQLFGSGVQRFPETDSSNIGPGFYQVDSMTKNGPSQTQSSVSKAHSLDRMGYAKNQFVPGPGYYNYQISKPKKFKQTSCFASKKQRFQTQVSNYKQVKKHPLQKKFTRPGNKNRKSKTVESIRKPSSSFISKQKRIPEQKNQIPFGCYDIEKHDITSKIAQQNAYRKQLEKCNIIKPAFMSSTQRFQAQEEQQANTHKDCWCERRVVQKQTIQAESSSFASNEKRIGIFEQKGKSPDIGKYYKEHSFIRQSFNAKFLKNGQNQTKKITAWVNNKKAAALNLAMNNI